MPTTRSSAFNACSLHQHYWYGPWAQPLSLYESYNVQNDIRSYTANKADQMPVTVHHSSRQAEYQASQPMTDA